MTIYEAYTVLVPTTVDTADAACQEQGDPMPIEIGRSANNAATTQPTHVEHCLDEADATRETQDESKKQPSDEAVDFVRSFLAQSKIEILFDGSVRLAAAPSMATCVTEIEAFLDVEDIDNRWLLDELIGEARSRGVKIRKSDLERAVRKVTREEQVARRKGIVLPLLMPTHEVEDTATAAWSQLTQTVFETDPILAAACLKHFIWQVKRKLLNLPIQHHLMSVVWSPVQGGGKTTFIRKFLAPLRELATGPVLLSDFTDKRSGDIYRFPALFIDDMEQIDARMIPVLKSLVTSAGLRRRKLGTSMSEGHRQQTTLIGTANSAIDALVADAIGNRRFASLLFRNGKVENGGDAVVWDAVDATDYDLLWRSVDVFGPAPIAVQLAVLVALQEAGRPPDPLLTWLQNLDVQSEAVKDITTRDGVRANRLRLLFCEQAERSLTPNQFADQMAVHCADPTVPLGPKVEKDYGIVYMLKTVEAAA